MVFCTSTARRRAPMPVNRRVSSFVPARATKPAPRAARIPPGTSRRETPYPAAAAPAVPISSRVAGAHCRCHTSGLRLEPLRRSHADATQRVQAVPERARSGRRRRLNVAEMHSALLPPFQLLGARDLVRSCLRQPCRRSGCVQPCCAEERDAGVHARSRKSMSPAPIPRVTPVSAPRSRSMAMPSRLPGRDGATEVPVRGAVELNLSVLLIRRQQVEENGPELQEVAALRRRACRVRAAFRAAARRRPRPLVLTALRADFLRADADRRCAAVLA
jgi:hypothetical protein